MDTYTEETKAWLDNRYKQCDEAGIYIPHQPIYGFRKGPGPAKPMGYLLTYEILRTLARLDFKTFLDVGASEGYTANLVRHFFGAEIKACDLSEEACKRARDIFHIDARQADVHDLPYADGEFDVVLCSETLEHVPNFERAAREVIRVARRAAVLTVPHDSEEQIAEMSGTPHAHLYTLDLHSCDFIRPEVEYFESNPIVDRKYAGRMVMLASPIEVHSGKHSAFVYKIYNMAIPIIRKLFGTRLGLSQLIELDHHISRSTKDYMCMVYLVVKDRSCLLPKPRVKVSAARMLDVTVPLCKIT